MVNGFDTTQIAKRGELDGLDGNRYAVRPKTKPHDEKYVTDDPAFRKGAFKAMSKAERETFDNETMGRADFLLSKPNLAGNKSVSAYEDQSESELRFNPLKDLDEKTAGANTYDSGIHQGGESGSTFLRLNNVYRAGRPVTLEKPDPYAPKLASGIKIRM